MNLIEYNMRILDTFLEEELLNKYAIGHVHNPSFVTNLTFHANLIADSIANLFPNFLTNTISQRSRC